LRRSLEVGSFLGRYQILGPLGAGGMGVVYRARDAELGRDVAVKLVTTTGATSDTLATRLMREAQALAQLSHPNVVAVYDVGRVEDGVFLAMELVAGDTGDAWIKKRPPWREVLQKFRDAGRGLAAAHKVGLVHRDFKPANLILGSDGRVRVLDFGLARTAQSGMHEAPDLEALGDEASTWSGDAAEEVETRDARLPPKATATPLEPLSPTPKDSVKDPMSSSERRLLETPLTQVGSIVGTPPYMAPEQHLGGGCDARTDQFSFCVAFYQALYGERPFDGANYAELSTNIIKGKAKAAPAGSSVPAWLRAVVMRGLSVSPEKRFATMDAILEAMARDPAVRRRRIASAAAVTLLVAVAGVASWRSLHGPSPCRGAEREVDGVWNGARKQAVRAAFAKTGKPFAADAFTAVAAALDGYGARWAAMQTEACEATRVRGTQSSELLDLRMQCLQRRLDDVRAQVDLFSAADDEVVTRAPEMSRSLPPLAECADTEALRAPVRPPADPAAQKRVVETRKALATAHALWQGGRYPAAQKQIAPVVDEAHAIGYRPLEGEALLQAARIADSSGDYARAKSAYTDAAVAADAGRDDETAALAACGLVWVLGERLGKYAEAHEEARAAQAKIERLGKQEILQAQLDAQLSVLFMEEGKYKEAEASAKRVLATREKVLGPEDFAVGEALGDLGDVEVQLGAYDEAITLYRRALSIIDKTFGGAHPKAGSLHVNLGAALRSGGHLDEAVREYRRADEIIERSLGREHPMLATVDINYGAVLLEQGHDGEAEAAFKRALAIWTKQLGADHPSTGTAWFRLGNVALRQGRAAEARADYQKTLDIWTAKLGAEHPSVSAALDGLGDALLAEGKTAAAMSYYRRALALGEKTLGPTHPELADALIGIGLVELAGGASKRAIAPLERALALREKDGDAIELARARFALARALAGTNVTGATALANQARSAYAQSAAGNARELGEIDRWLHRGP
jgi:serine/threonine protein kinase/tetratricopeptide (TPR) repeat protein